MSLMESIGECARVRVHVKRATVITFSLVFSESSSDSEPEPKTSAADVPQLCQKFSSAFCICFWVRNVCHSLSQLTIGECARVRVHVKRATVRTFSLFFGAFDVAFLRRFLSTITSSTESF